MSRSKDSTLLGIVYSDPLALWALDFLIRRQHAPIDIIWAYSSGKDVLQNIDNFEHPQAILIDLDLLDINYSILSRRIKLIDSNIGTVGIASSLPQESLEARNTSQINLIVHKKDSIEEIIRAVGSVSNHPKLMHWTSKDQASPLSKKELQIIRMTARGFTYAAIGRQLHISEQTVKNLHTPFIHQTWSAYPFRMRCSLLIPRMAHLGMHSHHAVHTFV